MRSRRFVSIFVALLFAAPVLGSAVQAQASAPSGGPLVWGVYPYDNSNDYEGGQGLQSFDASTGKLVDVHLLTVGGVPVTGAFPGANGLALDPSTSTAYIDYREDSTNGARHLGTVNLSTGDITNIGDLKEGSNQRKIAGIVFNATGSVLYAISGAGGSGCVECLYTVNKATGGLTYKIGLSTGVDCDTVASGTQVCGAAIGLDPTTGTMYHAVGRSPNVKFFSLDPTQLTPTETPIPLTGAPINEVYGLAYDSATGSFIATDYNGDVFTITTTGVVTKLSSLDSYLRLGFLSTAANTTAVRDTETVAETFFNATPTTFDVLANDIPGTGPAETIASVSQPVHGVATVTNGGADLSYQPYTDYCNSQPGGAPDVFSYTLSGGSTASVAVTITCVVSPRTITLTYSPARSVFKGTVTAGGNLGGYCIGPDHTVNIFRDATTDKKVATTTTDYDANSNTIFKVKKAVPAGKYYASVALEHIPNKVDCGAAQSPDVRVR